MAKPGKTMSSSMELTFQPLAKTFEDLTLDSGYGDMAGSCRSSVLSLSPSHLDTPPPGALWTLQQAVGAQGCPQCVTERAGRHVLRSRSWATLPPVEWVPWTEKDVGTVMRKSLPTWEVSPGLVRQVSSYLGRALQRVALEAQRLSLRCAKCTKQEVQAAARLVLSWALAEVFVSAGARGLSQYNMSAEEPWSCSKSTLCTLDLSVGRTFRWMLEARVAPVIHEHAAIYMTAGMQALLELLCARLGPVPSHRRGILPQPDVEDEQEQALERLLNSDAELWGIFQPYQHLICGRNAYGVLVLPACLTVYGRRSLARVSRSLRMSELQALESSLLATVVDSITELSALVMNISYYLQRLTALSSGTADKPPFHQGALSWEPGALHTLFYYTQRGVQPHISDSHGIQLTRERPEAWLPPLSEWLRVCVALAEHRHSLTVDSGDVQQAARLLLPGVDVEPRPLRVECCLYASKLLEASVVKRALCWNLAFRMLSCGRTDLVDAAAALLGPDGINTLDQQGLSPLMYSCTCGDEAMVQVLLDSGASIDLQVPGSGQHAPSAHPETRYWTALTFAVAFGHTSVAQLLLDRGADPNGCIGDEGTAETPLHLAAAAGRFPLVSLLLEKGADPLCGTSCTVGGGASLRGTTSAFSLAAAHGHRVVLWTLLSTINSDIVSLEDMLEEGLVSQNTRRPRSGRSKRIRQRALQGALYHSAEHGFLDIAMQLRQQENVPWTLHPWLQCLSTSFSQQCWEVMHSLLGDFPTRQDMYSKELVHEGLPLLFKILKTCQSESTVHQLAAILSGCYGPYPVPPVHEDVAKPHTTLDPAFLNNKEMCDITFLVEGELFYGHKDLVSSASPGLEKLICEASAWSSVPVEVPDIKYKTFQLVMQYIYSGAAEGFHIGKQEALEVLHAAHVFGITGLKRHCELLCSKNISPSDAANVYRQAKVDQATELKTFCEGYFLKNMVTLLDVSSFRRLLLASEDKDSLGKALLHTLTARMQALNQPTTKETMV
uniref:Ankyrin repeat and BTB/POZ domain-containing protein 2-like n=1 Tax=Paramormyrops kingsleyae TaxID=1676925 RepID=A0A3B3RP60_9TELE|nr:ankyrin repeat and BTB/POZ domain-containing protein 2-like [Paramormyrops kingsleyae]